MRRIMLTVFMAAIAYGPPPASDPSVAQRVGIVVWSTDDHGPGTLRQALLDARPGDTVMFDQTVFPPATPSTIWVADLLPELTRSRITLDASNAGVVVDGSGVGGEWSPGLVVDSRGNAVRGLQIVNFTGPQILLQDHASWNVIGGDRDVGTGPLGQGNVLGGGADGLALFGADHNTIRGNVIGTDVSGRLPLANLDTGILLQDGACDNVVGPANNIANSGWAAIDIPTADSTGNTITQNSIHNNWYGIHLISQHPQTPPPPSILGFDLSGGLVEGVTCPSCVVEVFSGDGIDAGVFEGSVIANASGAFALSAGRPLTGPALRATATANDGSTGALSLPTSGEGRRWLLQAGDGISAVQIEARQSEDIAANGVSTSIWFAGQGSWPVSLCKQAVSEWMTLGVKRIRLSFNEIEVPYDPATDEFSISKEADACIRLITSNGVAITYVMSFWDKLYQAQGGTLECARFQNESEIGRYLEYVRFLVRHLRSRVDSFEIWNEPDNPTCHQGIEADDYIGLVRQTVPVIREEDPKALIALAGTAGLSNLSARAYLSTVLHSDIMPIVDVVSWHPFYGESPLYPDTADYYAAYSSLVQKIKTIGVAAGFTGEYRSAETIYRVPQNAAPDQPWVYSEVTAAKYYARAVVRDLGLGVVAGLGLDPMFMITSSPIANLATVMAGAGPTELQKLVDGATPDLAVFTFALPNGDRLVALWRDGIAFDDSPATEVSLTIPGLQGRVVDVVDVLRGYRQQLHTSDADAGLVIAGLQIQDYPIIVRITP